MARPHPSGAALLELLVAVLCVGCTGSKKEAARVAEPPAASTSASPASGSPSGTGSVVAAAPVTTIAPPPAPPLVTALDVARVLFADASDPATARWTTECPLSQPDEARIRCVFQARYAGDPEAARLAHGLFTRHGVKAGVEIAHTMNGGYRGMIQIAPAVPTKDDRKHLVWLEATFKDFEAFFEGLAADAGPAPSYRFRPIDVRFMRSLHARTPSAYASGWQIAYNLDGSLNVSETQVRETMFHEIFHLNDEHHQMFSERSLSAIFDGIVKKCGTKTPCLAPYSPGDTMVRGGTWYSFQPGNGVREYGAELAVRYYREQRARIRGEKIAKPFKCGPRENVDAWRAFVAEFFAGKDLVPACP